MTILPPTKAKKMRKDEKRGDEWSGQRYSPSDRHTSIHSIVLTSGQSASFHSNRIGISTNSLSHTSHSTHATHSSRPSSLSSGPPRKVARKGGVSTLPSSSCLPPSTQPLISNPRGSREEHLSVDTEEQAGPNSDDEYERGFRDEQMERDFEGRLRDELGLEIKKMVGDGACLFRAVSHQIYGDEDMHGEVRRLCLDYMEKNREHFEEFITEDFAAYITRKRCLTVHGNHVELQAISEIYNRPIEIYEYNIVPVNMFHPKSTSSGGNEKRDGQINAPIRLSYHGNTHYNAVIDPRVATVGVGLGLPSFNPGMADRQLIAEAISNSEMHQIEQAMLNDKMSMTDWERTEEDLKDQILRESYMEYTRSVEGSNQPSTSSSCLAPSRPSSYRRSLSPQPCSSRHIHSTDKSAVESAIESAVPPPKSSLYEELLMAEALEWNDDSNYQDSSLAEALLISQQTYLTEYIRRPDGQGGSKD